MADMIRVNTRVSLESNKWMDNYSKLTGLPKSTIIMLAIESFIEKKKNLQKAADLGLIVSKLEELEKKIIF